MWITFFDGSYNLITLPPKVVIYLKWASCFLKIISYSAAAGVFTFLCLTNSQYNSAHHTVETNYVNWVTKLPAYTICPEVNRRNIVHRLKQFINIEEITPRNVSFYANLVRPGREYCVGCSDSSPHSLFESVKLSHVVKRLSQQCEEQLYSCSWNDVNFSCCHLFQPISTRHGICFTMNSEQALLHQPTAVLRVQSNVPISAYVHDRKAIPNPRIHPMISPGETGELLYKYHEVVAHSSASELSIQQRRCLLENELTLPNFNLYSYTACKLTCLAKKQLHLAQCRHHFLPDIGPECNVTGLQRIDAYNAKLRESNYKKSKTACHCKRDCSELEISFVHFFRKKSKNEKRADLTLTLTKPPTEKIILSARITFVETIVCFACLTRLVTTATFEDIVRDAWFLLQSYFFIITKVLQYPFKMAGKHLKSE